MRFFPTLLTATTTVAAVAAAPVVAAAPAASGRAEISTSVEVVSVDHPFASYRPTRCPRGSSP